MTDDSTEIVRGSGNVFRDFGYPDADVRQAKALLAAQIIKVLDAEELTTRQAEARTGVAHSEFVRIRNVNLARFTMDRLVTNLGRLDQEVEFSFTVHPRAPREAKPENGASVNPGRRNRARPAAGGIVGCGDGGSRRSGGCLAFVPQPPAGRRFQNGHSGNPLGGTCQRSWWPRIDAQSAPDRA